MIKRAPLATMTGRKSPSFPKRGCHERGSKECDTDTHHRHTRTCFHTQEHCITQTHCCCDDTHTLTLECLRSLKTSLSTPSNCSLCPWSKCSDSKLGVTGAERNLEYVGSVHPVTILLDVLEMTRENPVYRHSNLHECKYLTS